ncbi:MAG: aspartyl/asparaginyl beta-hydroxylase domain-containing protein [Pseudomonadota bacterium]|nr:aspartyl/asparaginyl beta-hydroxylase domain-containing protein [Pseudomonadota bacterium]
MPQSAPVPLKKRIRKAVVRRGKRLTEAFEHWLGRMSPVGDREILDKRDFPWTAALETNWRLIRAELDEVLKERERLPNLQDISAEQRYLTNDGGWKSYFFTAHGVDAEENRKRCPETARLLDQIPDLAVAHFSILSPGKHIPAHKGIYKGLIRAHLGLITPAPREKCRMRLGRETICWKEGEIVVFDDTYEHEVWNDTDGWRVVLLIDVVRPFPFPLSAINRTLLKLIRRSAFVTDAAKKHKEWEKGFYGKEAA